jgi:hypothetical protein
MAFTFDPSDPESMKRYYELAASGEFYGEGNADKFKAYDEWIRAQKKALPSDEQYGNDLSRAYYGTKAIASWAQGIESAMREPNIDKSAYLVGEGPTQYGRKMIDQALAIQSNQELSNQSRMQIEADRYAQMKAIDMMQAMQRRNSIASQQAELAREGYARASRGNAMQQINAASQGALQSATGAISGTANERIQGAQGIGQSAASLKSQDVSRYGQDVGDESARNMWNLAKEKAAQDWAQFGLKQREAISKSAIDYQQFTNAIKQNQRQQAMNAAFLKKA